MNMCMLVRWFFINLLKPFVINGSLKHIFSLPPALPFSVSSSDVNQSMMNGYSGSFLLTWFHLASLLDNLFSLGFGRLLTWLAWFGLAFIWFHSIWMAWFRFIWFRITYFALEWSTLDSFWLHSESRDEKKTSQWHIKGIRNHRCRYSTLYRIVYSLTQILRYQISYIWHHLLKQVISLSTPLSNHAFPDADSPSSITF